MNNVRFATAVHILTLLADSPENWLSSELIAGSINLNPVVVRRELGVLRAAGLVSGRRGKEGGAILGRPSHEISFRDIYLAVKNSEVLGRKNLSTNQKCPIGREINEKLAALFEATDQIVIDFLGNRTLADFVREFN